MSPSARTARSLSGTAGTGEDRVDSADPNAHEAAESALRSVLHPDWPMQHIDVEAAFRDGYRVGVHSTASTLTGLHALAGADSGELRRKLDGMDIQYDFTSPMAEEPKNVVSQAIRGLAAHLPEAATKPRA